MDQVFMDNNHCPRCRGTLNKRKPSKDKFLGIKTENMIRLWCPCGYYKDVKESETS